MARRAMRAQVSEMAFALFVERGYEETTVEDICEVAGISRSTFFRYFPTKEDVFMGEMSVSGEIVLAALREQPDDKAPWTALRMALTPLIEHYDADPGRRPQLIRFITTTPVLAVQHIQKAPAWHALLEPEVVRRLGSVEAADPRPAALVSAMLGCLDSALKAWAAGNGSPELISVLEQAMGAIHA